MGVREQRTVQSLEAIMPQPIAKCLISTDPDHRTWSRLQGPQTLARGSVIMVSRERNPNYVS